MKEEISKIKEKAAEEIAKAKNLQELNDIRVKTLGKKGELTSILRGMESVDAAERPIIGSLVNETKTFIEEALEAREKLLKGNSLKEKLEKEKIDVTVKGTGNNIGSIHPITGVIDNIKEIFVGLGYEIADGPEVEKTYYVFDQLNTPIDHPARDLQDTFYITDDIILRTQTSSVQIRVMENKKPPIKIICPGAVYRSDSIDPTHSAVFHQIEGLVVDKGITMADLKGTLEIFAKRCLGENTKIRFRPHHFPYTEPSAEVDVSCFVCGGKGCRICKNEGWIELLGCRNGTSKSA